LAELGAVAPALGSGVQTEQGYVWFDTEYIYAYSGLGVRKEFKTALNCGVPGKQLQKLLETSSLKEVTLAEEKGHVLLQMGRSKIKLANQDIDRLPWRFKDPTGKGLTLTKEIYAAFKRLSTVRASKGQHAYHHGVILHPSKTELDSFATDGRTIMRIRLNGGKVDRVILPWAFLERVRVLTKPDKASLHVMGDSLLVVGDGVLIASNMLDLPDQPDLGKLLDKYADAAGDPLRIPEGLGTALDRADALSGGGRPVTIAITKGALRLTAKYEAGALDESLSLSGKKLPEVRADLRPDLIRRNLEGANEFALYEQGMILYGEKDSFDYLIAGVK